MLRDSLELGCEWTDPSGVVRHRNHWHTKTINKDPWPTHCRYRLDLATLLGHWTVTMTLGARRPCGGSVEIFAFDFGASAIGVMKNYTFRQCSR